MRQTERDFVTATLNQLQLFEQWTCNEEAMNEFSAVTSEDGKYDQFGQKTPEMRTKSVAGMEIIHLFCGDGYMLGQAEKCSTPCLDYFES